MKPGKSRATGHFMELRVCPGKPQTRNEWNFETKQFDKVPNMYAYCRDCESWAWAWEAVCPKNCTYVYVKEKVAA